MTRITMQDSKYAILETELNGNILSLLRDIPVRKYFKDRLLKFELTGASYDFIKIHFPEAIWDPSTAEAVKSIEDIRKIEKASIDAPETLIPPEAQFFRFKTKPFEHQMKAWLRSRDQEFFGFFMEMGTGKTKLCIDTIAYLYECGRIDNVLILAPNNVHRQWIMEQLPLHLPDWVNNVAAYHRSSPSKEERAALIKLRNTDPGEGTLRILSMNIEALSGATGKSIAKQFCMTGRTLCILDESSRIKNHKANRTETVMELRDLCLYRRIATGTSITKGIEDLFTQLSFLHRDILGFTSFYAFRSRYCDVQTEMLGGGKQFSKIVGYKRVEELKQKLAAWTFQVKKEDCLDLPPKVYMERIVELHPDQQKLYTQMKDELIAQLSSGEIITAPFAITKMLRLQQIICGHLPNEDGSYEPIPRDGKNPRIEAVKEILEETQEQVIVWGRFTADIDFLMKEFQGMAVRYDGQTTEKQRVEAMELFKSGQRRLFVGNPMAAGIGLNLTEATLMIYYSNDFNAETRWQSEDRIHRIGQTKSVTIIDLVTPGTIDRKILQSLKSKKSIAELVANRGGIRDFLAE